MTSIATVANTIEAAGEALASAVENEMMLEDNRIGKKMAAIERIISAGENPLTGKKHSFSSAEALVNTDGEYMEYLEQMRHAAVKRIRARATYEAAIVAGQMQARMGA